MNNYNWKILGHENILNFLERSITSEKLAHAYLFSGPKAVGKNYLAHRFIQVLECESENIKPCEHCPTCRQIKKGIHPDIYFLEKEADKKNISIDQVRELQRKLSLNSFNNGYKIALIDQAETLSNDAWGSLLKTLEEPTPKTIIILIASALHQIPQTILSRSQLLRFRPVPTQKIANYLAEELKIESNQALSLANLSFGRIGKAIKFIEDPQSYIDYKKKAGDFIKIINSNFGEGLKIIESYASKSKDNAFLENIAIYQNLLQNWELVLRDLVLLKLNQANLANKFLEPEQRKIEARHTLSQLKSLLNNIEATKLYLVKNVSPKLAMENLLMNIT